MTTTQAEVRGSPPEGAEAPLARAERLVLLAGVVLVTVAVVGTRLGTSPATVVFWDNVHWTVAYATAATTASLAARRAEGALRRSRRWFAAGLSALLLGQLSWDAQVAADWNPFPGPSDVFFVSMGPLLGAGVLTLTRGQSRARRAAVLLDGLGFGLVVLALTLATYLPRRGDFGAFTMAVLAAYPTGLLTVSALLVVVLLELREAIRWQSVLLVLAIFGQGLLWMWWNQLTLVGGLGDGKLVNYLFSYESLVLGAAVATFRPFGHEATASQARAYYLVSRLLPVVLVGAAAVAVVIGGDLPPTVRAAVTACMAGVILVAVIRQSLLLEERDRLLAAEAQTRELSARLAASQRLESLGTLASGIAHDFNNILTAIVGNVELLSLQQGQSREVEESLHSLRSASARATDLVRRILAFSRKDGMRRESVDLTELVHEVVALLRAALPVRHALSVQVRTESCVLADAAQIHQVLMNLGTNASHAIGDRPGAIQFVVQERHAAATPAGAPARYVEVSVRDDGCGMDEDTRARAFEPFFTTKPRGEGTGLGLSVVHGIVTEHGGAVELESAPGQGTTVRVLLPWAEAKPAPTPTARVLSSQRAQRPNEVLVVDDEPMVAAALVRLCSRLGQPAVSTTSAVEAVRLVHDSPRRFALVVTDMSMPEMSGIELAGALRSLRNDIRIVLSSGTDLVVTGTPFDGVLPKPYAVEAVAGMLELHVPAGARSDVRAAGRASA